MIGKMKKKAVFFDIDGTLWDNRHQRIPASASQAVRRLRENGACAFLCSGRTRANIRAKELFDLGFDGVLAGCGTYIEYRGQVIFEKTIPCDKVQEMLKVLGEYRMPTILEGSRYLYAQTEAFVGDSYVAYLRRALGNDLKDLSEYDGTESVNKLSAVYYPESRIFFERALGQEYGLIFHGGAVVEVVPKGFSKATGIQKICEYLGIDREDTYAFGDGNNDVEMLSYVRHGVAMGDGTENAKKAADYVTSPLEEDGIRNGLAHFGLI